MSRKQIDFLKLERLCDYRRKRSSNPWNFFHKKIEYIEEVLIHTQKKIKDQRILNLIHKQQIVSLVTALEVYLREMFIYIIDEEKIKSDPLLNNIKKEVSLLDIMKLHNKINKNKWQQAELLANEYKFQNFDEAISAFKKLTNMDIKGGLRKYKIQKNEVHFQLDKDFDIKIKEILQLRHSIIHDINFRRKISYDKCLDIYDYIHFFVDIFDFYIRDKVMKLNIIFT